MAEQKETKQKVTVKTSEIIKMLRAGKDRNAIAKELNLSKSDIKRIFENPKLKGKKVSREPGFVLEDDIEEEVEEVEAETSGNGAGINETKEAPAKQTKEEVKTSGGGKW